MKFWELSFENGPVTCGWNENPKPRSATRLWMLALIVGLSLLVFSHARAERLYQSVISPKGDFRPS